MSGRTASATLSHQLDQVNQKKRLEKPKLVAQNRKELRHIYLFPGLGADERLFKYLEFPDDVQVHCLHYPIPNVDETLLEFSQRLSLQVLEKPYAYIGCSIGGIFSIETAKQKTPQKLLLIGSIKNKNERPFYLALFKFIRLHHWLSMDFAKQIGGLASQLAGGHRKEDLELLAEMLKGTPNKLITWGIDQILDWENNQKPCEIVHIHGSRDLIFPTPFLKDIQTIEKGAHFSILLNKQSKINNLIKKAFSDKKWTQK